MIQYKQYRKPKPASLGFFTLLLRYTSIAVRLCLLVGPATTLYLFHSLITHILFIDVVRRYLTCVTNLICIRLILLILGFFHFDNDSYRFFTREARLKFTLRSGYIGIANHTNIIDLLFYSYLLSPIYVKPLFVLDEKGNNKSTYFVPYTFLQAFTEALSATGFLPTYIKEEELNRIKARKLSMKLLVVQSFENVKGPILVLLPGIHPGKYLPVEQRIVDLLQHNQTTFSRWTVAFCTSFPTLPGEPDQPQRIYEDQRELLWGLLSGESGVQHVLKVVALQLHRNNYHEKPFKSAIDEFYVNVCGLTPIADTTYYNYVQGFKAEKEKQQSNYQLSMQNKKEE